MSDLAQRALTLNKLEQRRNLAASLRRLRLRPGASILDFGCGTGLFAPTVRDAGLRYRGYDPDAAAVRYASRRYPGLPFVSRLDQAATSAPYDIVLANCCFHHIGDTELLNATLPVIADLMHDQSVFVLIDVLPLETDASTVRRIFNRFEQGTFKRTVGELERLLAGRFVVRLKRIQRFFVLSAPSALNPLYNDVVQFELVLPSSERSLTHPVAGTSQSPTRQTA